jgi:hypothetical protein
MEYNKAVEKVSKFKTLLFENVGKLKRIKTKIKKPSFTPHLPSIKINPMKQGVSYLRSHKFWIGGTIVSIFFILFIAGAIYQGYFQNFGSTAKNSVSAEKTMDKSKDTIAIDTNKPSPVSPSPSSNPSPSASAVLGTTDNSDADTSSENETSPSPEDSPIPTNIPVPTDEPTSAPVTTSSSNSNCTTGGGVANSWYSDIYPVSPITANGGSATLSVTIRDCNINSVSSSSTLKISLTSGDPNALVNGQNLPATITTQNGQVSFTVTSQVAGSVDLSVQDTTDSFSLTDTNNQTPSIVFNGQSGPTPVPTQQPTSAPTQPVSSTPTTSTAPSATPTP